MYVVAYKTSSKAVLNKPVALIVQEKKFKLRASDYLSCWLSGFSLKGPGIINGMYMLHLNIACKYVSLFDQLLEAVLVKDLHN